MVDDVIVAVDVPDLPSTVAVIVATPADIPVTTPLVETVATETFEEEKTAERPERVLPAASRDVTETVALPPTKSCAVDGLTETLATGTCCTVMLTDALLPSLVALIEAAPGATAVTSPVALTVALVASVLDHATVRPISVFPAPSRAVAVSWTEAPGLSC